MIQLALQVIGKKNLFLAHPQAYELDRSILHLAWQGLAVTYS